MRNTVSTHCANIGRRGGRVSSPAKRSAARLNAWRRWHGKAQAILPLELLQDGVWYHGHGRNSKVGLWDAQAECFWTIAVNDFADPAAFPAKPARKVRLKREDYFGKRAGTFKPVGAIAK